MVGARGHLARVDRAIASVQVRGCRAWVEVLCSCRRLAQVEPTPTLIEGARGGIPAGHGDYAGPLRHRAHRQTFRAHGRFPRRGRRPPRHLLARVLGVAGVARPSTGVPVRGLRAPGERWRCGWYPRPPSWKRRLQGRRVAMPLARAVAQALAASARAGSARADGGCGATARGCVVPVGQGGGAALRWGAWGVRALAVPPRGVLVVAVDDVVTTGRRSGNGGVLWEGLTRL